MIDEEITVSNARKFGATSSARAHFSNSTPTNGTLKQKQTNSMIEYQQRVDAARMEKMRQFYTFCDVQTEWRFTKSMSKPFDNK